MSPLHHTRGPYLSGFRGGSGVTSTAREPASKRASEETGKCVKNTSETEREAKAQRPQMRFRGCVTKMGEWQLTLLTFIVILPVWVLCNILLPRTLISLGIMGVSIYMARWANTTKAKGTCVGKSRRSSSGTDPMGEQPRPRAARADGSSELPRNGPSIGNMEELSRSLMDSLDIIAVCHDLMEEPKATPLKSRTPALRKSKSREYLVCLQCRQCVTSSCPHHSEPEEQQDLPVLVVILHGYYMVVAMGKLVEMKLELKFELVIGGKPVYTWEKAQLLCETDPETCYMDCDGSLPISLWGSKSSKAPHPVLKTPQGQMGPAGQDARATPDLQLAGQGESLPTAVPTRPRSPGDSETSEVSCPILGAQGTPEGLTRPANKDTRAAPDLQPAGQGESLPTAVPTRPRSPGDSETSEVPCPILRAQGTPGGQTRLARKDTRAAPDLQPAGQGESLPSAVAMYPRPPWAQPPSPAALERLHRAGLEPLPLVGFKGLGQGLSLQQYIRHSWVTINRRVGAALGYLCIAESSGATGTVEWQQMVQLDLQRRADALLYTTEVVV